MFISAPTLLDLKLRRTYEMLCVVYRANLSR